MGTSASRIPHSWPARRDPAFTWPNLASISVGDTCHEWTIVSIIKHVTHSYSVCNDTCVYDSSADINRDIQRNGKPAMCVPASGYHVRGCVPTEDTYPVFLMVCSCGSAREKTDPFDSRKCQRHATNLRELDDFIASLSALRA